jgi:hypothetical protein
MKHYSDYNYAMTRLNSTIVMYKGEPAYLHRAGPSDRRAANQVYLECPLTGREIGYVPLRDVDINPPKLGYSIPEEEGANSFYVSRSPKRAEWRQGLRSSALCSARTMGGVMLNNNQIATIIVGKYPSLAECKDVSRSFHTIRAFHRDFAVCYKSTTDRYNIEYKGVETVAYINSNNVIEMKKGKQWAFEALQLAIGEEGTYSNEEGGRTVAA